MSGNDLNGLEIAVIGMAGRFPGARDISKLWENLKNGIESISFFSEKELEEAGISPEMLKNPDYVKARGILEDKEYFDSLFFGYTPNETGIMDPQMRIFHECAWEALENAGCDPDSYNGLIGLYAGASSSFSWKALSLLSGKNHTSGEFESSQLNDKDFLCTKISFKLNLKGPSVSLQTACSTSLVAIHMACQALLNAECDMALAGGVTVFTSGKSGYLYREGMINSPDGHCRSFDAKAQGTVGGEGAGIVVLKRFEDATADRDNIYAIIKGSAINNDGIEKVGFTAPGVKGQAEVIRTAIQMAEIEPGSIGYIETHGTGTILGDPVEIEALKQGFSTQKKNVCAIGSIKTNMGHLDCAAGVAGFIKAVLALKHRLIPPSLFFKTPNPKIDFKNSPFYVNTRLKEWASNGSPRRAGVSSFGIGGTNAHVILEEAPVEIRDKEETRGLAPLFNEENSKKYQLILLSAKTQPALDRMTENLAAYLIKNPGTNLADTAYTLQVGRRPCQYRKMCVCSNVEEAIEALSNPGTGRIKTFSSKMENPPVVFMFPGQGSQYVNMGRDLYNCESVFREKMDRCFEILTPLMGYDPKEILYPFSMSARSDRPYSSDITHTQVTQPLLFVFSYALAKLLIEWGIKPYAMIGHSIGEYVAACLSGVFSLENALFLVTLRGRLMQKMPGGAMLSVPLSEEELKPLLSDDLSLAAVNGPSYCVVSGSYEAIDSFKNLLKEKGCQAKSPHTSHAFHSQLMEPMLEEFQEQINHIILKKPHVPYISNVTGDWINTREVTNTRYWAEHLRKTVRFADGVNRLLKEEDAIFLEVGPGNVLSTFVRQHNNKKQGHKVLNLVGSHREKIPGVQYILDRIGQLWFYGKRIHWDKFYPAEERHRILLPTYPFERQRYWIEGNPYKMGMDMLSKESLLGKNPAIEDWFYIPSWKQSRFIHLKSEKAFNGKCWLMFIDDCGLGPRLKERLNRENKDVICVNTGPGFEKVNDGLYVINPAKPDHYHALFRELDLARKLPGTIIHLWNVTKNKRGGALLEGLENAKVFGFYSLLYLAQVLGKQNVTDEIKMMVVTDNLQEVTGEECLSPGKALVLGPCKVIPKEYPNILCRSIDIVLPPSDSRKYKTLLDTLVTEFTMEAPDQVVAYRGNHRWIQNLEPVKLDKTAETTRRIKERGVYLVTGGLGGIGFVLAKHLASSVKAKLVLIGRSTFPAREKWNKWLSLHDEHHPTSIKIRDIREMEKQGAQVLVFSADAADPGQIKDVIAKTIEKFGQINGVIHSAGLPDGTLIQLRTQENSDGILTPKLEGTLVLNRMLKDVELDFVVLCSSLSSILAPLGQVGYCAANAFLDSFAYYKTANGTFTVSINWDAWQEVGMAVEAVNSQDELKHGILPSEGIEVFNRILDRALPQAAVSTRNLTAVMNIPRNTEGTKKKEESDEPLSIESTRPKPDLTTPYTAPRNETEQIIADIWEEIFGFGPIGIHDNFFELGGDSLKALHAVSRLKDVNIDIPVHKLILHQTIDNICSDIFPRKASTERFPGLSAPPCSVEVIPGEFPGSQENKKRDFLEEEVEREIEAKLHQNFKLTSLLKENKKVDEYPVSPIQRSYLSAPYTRISENIIFATHDLIGPVEIAQIKEIIIKLIKNNSLLRSVIKPSNTDYHVEEFDSFPNIQLPFIDISNYSLKNKEKILHLIYSILYEPFEFIDCLLYRLILLKFDNAAYKIIFAFNHLIFDGESVGILKNKIERLYRETKYNIHKKEESTNNYKEYTYFLNNRDYDKIDLKKYLDLPAYMKYIEKAVDTFKVEDLKYDGFELNISMLQDHLKNLYNEITLLSFAELICMLFELEEAPILFVSGGRNYKDGNFSNIIGDFHDRIPTLISSHRDQEINPGLIIEKCIEYRRYTRDNNLNFTHFLVKNLDVGIDPAKLFSPFSFNSLFGSYEHFKSKENNENQRKLTERKLTSPSALFQVSLIEDFSSDKLWVSFWQNSNFKKNEINELFIKNFIQLTETLNAGKNWP